MIPLRHTVYKISREYVGEDELGNDVFADVEKPVEVAGWSTPSSEEPKIAGHKRLVVVVEVIAPPGEFTEGDAIKIEPYGLLEVAGTPETYSHSPFGWDPGLVIVNAGRTT